MSRALPSACFIWPRSCILASPVARPASSSCIFPTRFFAVPLNWFWSMTLSPWGLRTASRHPDQHAHPDRDSKRDQRPPLHLLGHSAQRLVADASPDLDRLVAEPRRLVARVAPAVAKAVG